MLRPSGESNIAEALANNTIDSRIKRLGWAYSAILYFQLARPKVLGLDSFKDREGALAEGRLDHLELEKWWAVRREAWRRRSSASLKRRNRHCYSRGSIVLSTC